MKADFIREPVRYSPYARSLQTQPSSQGFPSQLGFSQLDQTNEQKYTNPASSAHVASVASSSELYLFDFGKHKGKYLDACGQIYRDWLVDNNIPSHRPGLKAALCVFIYSYFLQCRSIKSTPVLLFRDPQLITVVKCGLCIFQTFVIDSGIVTCRCSSEPLFTQAFLVKLYSFIQK